MAIAAKLPKGYCIQYAFTYAGSVHSVKPLRTSC
ncbi:hypothetical protein BN12_2610002 [Nostocoides japonicum T1-X7]|uniref:Uncharacterized protein n=1 Tax=Nostocoides japonicum T1-X7 TaxID=1194083 RepID=A0A077LW77_9MICO|nr:hypothetical protein BN12_2610002 [Tetrasphaera japonica T1-X7]